MPRCRRNPPAKRPVDPIFAMSLEFDTRMMARALQLARQGRYSAMPNPHVGCVLVRDGHVIGEGFTQPAGGNHAEIEALAAAGDAPELMVIGGAEIYRLLLDQADCLDITHIEAEYEGDTWFPAVDWAAWQIETEQRVAAEGDTPAHRFVTWIRRAV